VSKIIDKGGIELVCTSGIIKLSIGNVKRGQMWETLSGVDVRWGLLEEHDLVVDTNRCEKRHDDTTENHQNLVEEREERTATQVLSKPH
jgi:hypothetical protein